MLNSGSFITFSTLVGKTYNVELTIDNGSASQVNYEAYPNAGGTPYQTSTISTAGTYNFSFTALTTSTDLKVVNKDNSGSGVTFSVDDVEVNTSGFLADIKSANDYYPFGWVMPGRKVNSGDYRYGYQGSEKDNEVKGDNNQYTTFYRGLDPRIGRWLSVDPKANYSESPYVSMGNNPIWKFDFYGDTTYQFNKEGEYLGMGNCDEDGVRGAIGEMKTYEDCDGNKTQMFETTRNFNFNDPESDKGQLNELKIGEKAITFVSDENLNFIMNQEGIRYRYMVNRFIFADAESGGKSVFGRNGGAMDFGPLYFNGSPGGGTNDFIGGFYLFGNSSPTVFNAMDAGNFAWGHAMSILGFDLTTAQWGSQYNENFNDTEGDQRAIKSGFLYKTSTMKREVFRNLNYEKKER